MFTFQTRSKPKEDQWVVSLSPLKVLIRYKRDTGQEGEAALRIDLNCRQRDRGGKRAGGEGEEGGTRERRTRAATQARAATAPEEKRERGREREGGGGEEDPTREGDKREGNREEGEGDGRSWQAVAKGGKFNLQSHAQARMRRENDNTDYEISVEDLDRECNICGI